MKSYSHNEVREMIRKESFTKIHEDRIDEAHCIQESKYENTIPTHWWHGCSVKQSVTRVNRWLALPDETEQLQGVGAK